ncbi:hypothetical protein [Kitasatospora setae]|uniref:hypothetical protein n=1 Tax=Kitasatospora setae TaxID=2066 RepID=UPI0019285DA0|nr:hypothetical protein [Kitasatospora setae]
MPSIRQAEKTTTPSDPRATSHTVAEPRSPATSDGGVPLPRTTHHLASVPSPPVATLH